MGRNLQPSRGRIPQKHKLKGESALPVCDRRGAYVMKKKAINEIARWCAMSRKRENETQFSFSKEIKISEQRIANFENARCDSLFIFLHYIPLLKDSELVCMLRNAADMLGDDEL